GEAKEPFFHNGGRLTENESHVGRGVKTVAGNEQNAVVARQGAAEGLCVPDATQARGGKNAPSRGDPLNEFRMLSAPCAENFQVGAGLLQAPADDDFSAFHNSLCDQLDERRKMQDGVVA